MANPLALMPIPRTQWCDGDGAPLAGGVLRFYIVGTSTPRDVYTTADGDVPLGTTVTLDGDGRAAAIYLGLGGYKVTLEDSTGTLVWTQDQVETTAETLIAALGTLFATGASAVTSGYKILETDLLVTVDSTGGPDPCVITLPAASDRTAQLTIKNLGTVALAITPDGTDTIEGLSLAALTVPVAANPNFPTVTLVSDGTGWWILSSHGVGTLT
jgi:hypothetical protein